MNRNQPSNRRSLISLCAMLLLCSLSLSLMACSDNEADNNITEDHSREVRAAFANLLPQPAAITPGTQLLPRPQALTVSTALTEGCKTLLKETAATAGMSYAETADGEAFVRYQQDTTLPEEGYRLTIADEGITLQSATDRGAVWGIQTLRQLLKREALPEGTVTDSPRSAWRTYHLDVARHMFSIATLQQVIDELSACKISRFVLQLSDDQGWRMEMKRHPELTTTGAYRDFDEYDRQCQELAAEDEAYQLDPAYVQGSTYGGFYTQEQLAALVRYASERGVDIVPEIDMPGHCGAAIRTYPSLACHGKLEVSDDNDHFTYPICVSKEQTWTFVKDVLDELMAIFPSTYIHIGGDEFTSDNGSTDVNGWHDCPDCQQLKEELGYTSDRKLQTWFMQRVTRYLESNGRKAVAWDDAFDSANHDDVVYTFWRDWKTAQPGRITQTGHRLVVGDWGSFYLSATQTDDSREQLFDYNLTASYQGIILANVMGYQASTFTERIPNATILHRQIYPSIVVFGEKAWGSTRSWDSLKALIDKQKE